MNNKNTFKDVSLHQRMANIPRTRCAKCNKYKSYENPTKKCWECKRSFCYDHIWAGLIKEGMKKTEELRSVCERCKDRFDYKEI